MKQNDEWVDEDEFIDLWILINLRISKIGKYKFMSKALKMLH